MDKFKGCLLVTDIDGTLADGRYINPANISAVRRFIADGGKVALATGRSPQSSVPVAEEMGCESLLIANNGTVVYDCTKKEIIWQQELACPQIGQKVLDRYKSVGVMFYRGTELTVLSYNKQLDDLIESERLTVSENSSNVVNKILFSGTPQLLDELYTYCIGAVGSQGTVVRSDDLYVEILPVGADKGTAMLAIAEKFNVLQSNIFAAGNYYNDITLLKNAAVSCVPQGSPEQLCRMADHIACPCREGAVADFIEYLYTV